MEFSQCLIKNWENMIFSRFYSYINEFLVTCSLVLSLQRIFREEHHKNAEKSTFPHKIRNLTHFELSKICKKTYSPLVPMNRVLVGLPPTQQLQQISVSLARIFHTHTHSQMNVWDEIDCFTYLSLIAKHKIVPRCMLTSAELFWFNFKCFSLFRY